MAYSLSQLFWSVIGQLVIALMVGAIVAIWGKLQKKSRWSNPLAIVYGLVTTAAIFFIINQSGWWEPPIKVKIRQWMDEVKFSTKDMTDKNHHFRFEVIDQIGRVFYVDQTKDEWGGFVAIYSHYNIRTSFPETKNLTDPKLINELERQLRIDLAHQQIEYRFSTPPLTIIEFQCGIPVSSLTQDTLMNCIRRTGLAMQIVMDRVGLIMGK